MSPALYRVQETSAVSERAPDPACWTMEFRFTVAALKGEGHGLGPANHIGQGHKTRTAFGTTVDRIVPIISHQEDMVGWHQDRTEIIQGMTICAFVDPVRRRTGQFFLERHDIHHGGKPLCWR